MELPEEKLDGPEDRLSDNCVEPNETGYGEPYSGSFGPEKIRCCHTAKKAVKDVERRCSDCTDAVPCWKTMEEKWCGIYMKKYKEEEAKVCRARPTTTTTTTTTTTVTTTTTTTEAPATTTTTKEPELAWCYKLCGEVAQSKECQDPDRCKKFCEQAAEKFAKM